MLSENSNINSSFQLHTISYRNGLYQGAFDNKRQLRQNFGLIFTTDNHMIMGSNKWENDKPNQATFIYLSHSHYLYGFWNDGVPDGFNAVRFDKVVIFAWYQRGSIKGRILVIYQQYNTAVVLEVGQNQDGFEEVNKGDIFSDEDFNEHIRMCNWPQFQQNWKTLIKFMSANLVQQKQSKNATPKLRLVNQTYYRYGFDQGIAIVFDDEYKIISVGVHKRANLKSLGVKFTKQNFIEQGNFNASNQIYAFNHGHRPELKIGKIYNNYLLKSVQFVNKYLSNPAKMLISYLQDLIKSNMFRRLLAGQITTRKLDVSYESPQKSSKFQSNKKKTHQKSNQPEPKNKQQQTQKLKQQKNRLQAYKKQIYDSISKKNKTEQNYKQIQATPPTKLKHQKIAPIITKPPVQIATRTSHHHQKLDSSKNKLTRSPIFTPDKNQSRSVSPSNLSPFQQRMRSKIFKNQDGAPRKSRKYVYTPIDQNQLYPKHTDANLKKYNSPHEQLDFSVSRSNVNEPVLPISVRNQMLDRIRQSVKNDVIKNDNKKKNNQILIQQPIKKEQKVQKNPQNKDQNQNTKKVIRNFQKHDPTMSFRDPYLQNQSKRQYTNTNIPNIVISSPFKNKSPIRIKTGNQQDHREGITKKNNVYFKQSVTVPQFSPSEKPKKQIKGNTYLQKYKKAKNTTPQKNQPEQLQSKKYNKTIKSFNNNNRIYQQIQSPPKKTPEKTSKRTHKPVYTQEIPISYKQNKQKQFLGQTSSVKRKYQYVFN